MEAPPEGEVIGGNIIPTLTGTTWEWVDTTTPTETIVAVDPARYTITFNEDGTAAIMADCNSMSATYTADETGAISIVPGASTMMACPEDTQDQLFEMCIRDRGEGVVVGTTIAVGGMVDVGANVGLARAAGCGTPPRPTRITGGVGTKPL